MKKILVVMLLVASLCGCQKQNVNITEFNIDNGAIAESKMDTDGYNYIQDYAVNYMVEISANDAHKLFTEGTDAVLYFSYPGCHWCQRMLPVMLDASESFQAKVYYVNCAKNQNFDFNGFATKYFFELGRQYGYNDGRTLPLYTPAVIAIKDGKAVDMYYGSSPSYNDYEVEMTRSQYAEAFDIYATMIELAYN